MVNLWWIVGGCLLLALITGVAWVAAPGRRQKSAQRELNHALQLFRLQREQLEAKFFTLAVTSGKPRGVRWVDCDWQEAVSFARDVNTGLLTAFVSVNVRFEAVEGGDMEGVEFVGTVRDTAAVFHYQHGRWGTGGRALFNMNPSDAVARLQGQYEPVAQDRWRT